MNWFKVQILTNPYIWNNSLSNIYIYGANGSCPRVGSEREQGPWKPGWLIRKKLKPKYLISVPWTASGLVSLWGQAHNARLNFSLPEFLSSVEFHLSFEVITLSQCMQFLSWNCRLLLYNLSLLFIKSCNLFH